MDWLLALVLGYALGSIPFGLLLAKAAGKGDIRQVGSGNIGATNVLRTGSKWLAARLWTNVADTAALGVVVGHCFPVWLGFRGGKGVATAAGVCFGLGWPIGLAYAAVWLGMLAVTRISSLAGMSAAAAAPAAVYALGRPELVPVLIGIALIVLVQHRENFARLRAGTEPKVGRKE